jgi:hypothetical protein
MANPPTAANVKLLCHFDGTNGDIVTVDSSIYARTLTRESAASLSSAQAKFGATSSASGTSVNYRWTAPISADWDLGSGQFTIEGWVYFTSAPTAVHALSAIWGIPGALGFFFGHVSGNLAFYYSTTGYDNPNVGAAWSPTLNTWYHIAVDRDAANVLRIYLNGAVHASATLSATIFAPIAPYGNLDIGGNVSWGGIAGYVDDIRFVKGEAVYGGAFTPPSAALPDPGGVGSARPVVMVCT